MFYQNMQFGEKDAGSIMKKNSLRFEAQGSEVSAKSAPVPHVALMKLVLVLSLLGAMLGLSGLVGCTKSGVDGPDPGANNKQPSEPGSVDVRVASLKGPTSIGLVDFMAAVEEATDNKLIGNYDFQIYGTADEIMPQLVAGDIDIALLPANATSVLYNRTNGGITAIDINTLGVLYVVSADDSITTLADLADKTLLMTGKGTTPEYVMNYLLDSYGLTDRVTLEYRSEATELAAVANSDAGAIVLLPEPYATVVCAKNPNLARRISLTDEWRQVQQGGYLVTGVTVVRSEFLAEHPDVVDEFLAEHFKSVTKANDDPAAAAVLVVRYGLIEDAAIAEAAIPRCYLVCLTDQEMATTLKMYLEVLYAADPAAIGGAMPGDDFYYMGGSVSE